MFVKKNGKYFLTLTDSQVSIIMGLIHDRLVDLSYLKSRFGKEFSEEDYAELTDLQDHLIHYRLKCDNNSCYL